MNYEKEVEAIKLEFEEEYTFDHKNINVTINRLDKLFEKCERILTENSNRITDEFTNSVSDFSIECASKMFKNNEFKNVPEERLDKLFSHRHMAYGIYLFIDRWSEKDKNTKDNCNYIIKKYELKLFESLADYFDKFFGTFFNNELAIRMLCEYCPKKCKNNAKIKEKVVSALYRHMSIAGTHGDVGYAYDGIYEISNSINKLDVEIVKEILNQYEIYEIVNNQVYRNQIYTIIKYSQIEEAKKDEYKFFFIDSIMIVDIISDIINQTFKKENIKIIRHIIRHKKCCDKKLVIYDNVSESTKCFWSWDEYYRRTLKGNRKYCIEILYDNKYIIVKNNLTTLIKEKFDIDDWVLNKYNTYEFSNNLDKKLSSLKAQNSNFLMSHIWINDYRGIKNQQLSFDHNFEIKRFNKGIKLLRNNDSMQVPKGFYGKSIYSISAIVGKNGTGKTSIIDFLKNKFFKLIYLIDNKYLEIEQGLVQDNEYIEFENEFCIIFKIDEKFYFISNITKIENNINEINPYVSQPFKKKSENSKLIYFSNMINLNSTSTFLKNKIKDSNGNDSENQQKRSINNIGYIDFSESKSFEENNHEYFQYSNMYIDKYNKTIEDKYTLKNKNFWYQIAFLDKHSDDELRMWFGNNFKKGELVLVYLNINEEIEVTINEVIEKGDSKSIIENVLKSKSGNLGKSMIKLKYFSAGQYSKFSFLSKLYWCLDGYETYHEKIESVIGKNLFNIEDSLIKDSSAIIFIDEGELYYHPEWQRTYISTLLEFIKIYTKDKNVKLQIVITSNSPFIISDIATPDIMFLPNGSVENHILTFGTNIHTMLRDGFFMKSTIGEFAKNEIISTFDKLKDIKIKKDQSNYFNEKDQLKLKVNIVGDDLIKGKLERLFNECFPDDIISYQKELGKNSNDNLKININNIEKVKSTLKEFLYSLEEIKGEEHD